MDIWDDGVADLQAELHLAEKDLLISESERWAALQKEKEDHLRRYGPNFATRHIFKKKEEELVKDFNEKRAELRNKENKAWDSLIESDAKIPDKTVDLEPDLNQPYKEKVLELKKEREVFFKDHFEEMASIARDPSVPKEYIAEFLEKNNSYMGMMAKSHYKQLLDHPENPYWKQAIGNLKNEQKRTEKEKADRETERKRLEQKQINPVDVTGDLYERMRKKVKERREGHGW